MNSVYYAQKTFWLLFVFCMHSTYAALHLPFDFAYEPVHPVCLEFSWFELRMFDEADVAVFVSSFRSILLPLSSFSQPPWTNHSKSHASPDGSWTHIFFWFVCKACLSCSLTVPYPPPLLVCWPPSRSNAWDLLLVFYCLIFQGNYVVHYSFRCTELAALNIFKDAQFLVEQTSYILWRENCAVLVHWYLQLTLSLIS